MNWEDGKFNRLGVVIRFIFCFLGSAFFAAWQKSPLAGFSFFVLLMLMNNGLQGIENAIRQNKIKGTNNPNLRDGDEWKMGTDYE